MQEAAEAQQAQRDRIGHRKKKPSLIRAAKDGDLSSVQESLSDGADINQRGMWESTPLIYACQYGNSKVALLLIESGADVNLMNEKGCTPLLYAAVEGMSKVTRALLEKGADPNLPAASVYNQVSDTNEPFTPLHVSCANGSHMIVKQLLTNGVDPNRLDETGRSPLVLAIKSANERTAMEVLKYCSVACYGISDPQTNKTPMEYATANGMSKVQIYLTNKVGPRLDATPLTGSDETVDDNTVSETTSQLPEVSTVPSQDSESIANGQVKESSPTVLPSTPVKEKTDEVRAPMTPVDLKITED